MHPLELAQGVFAGLHLLRERLMGSGLWAIRRQQNVQP